jgi:hypothetical protein
MNSRQVDYQNVLRQKMAEEERVQHKIGPQGKRWRKAYFGGGAHYRNWLAQYIEVYGKENVMTEETDSSGFQCYEESGEKMYRIWVRDRE